MGFLGPPDIKKLKEKKNVKGLIKALNYKKEEKVRRGAAEALGQLGDPRAVEPLIKALGDFDGSVCESAAKALGELGDDRAVDPLLKVLGDSVDGFVCRRSAAEALRKLGDPRSVEQLLEEASSASMGDFVDNEDGTVMEQRTGLLWQRANDGTERNYEEALTYCQSLDLAGHHDWRLPRKEELAKLATVGFETLKEFFPNIKKERYWAHTMVDELYWAEAPERIAYTVDFDPNSGNYKQAITYFKSNSYYVRAVRDVR